MHNTFVTLKDGRKFSGPIWVWRPALNWFTIMDNDGEVRFSLSEVESATTGTPDNPERISINCLGVQDEMDRARKYMKQARQFGWDGVKPDMPEYDWEKK